MRGLARPRQINQGTVRVKEHRSFCVLHLCDRSVTCNTHTLTKTHTCNKVELDLILCLQSSIYHQDKEQQSKESGETDRTKGRRDEQNEKKRDDRETERERALRDGNGKMQK